MRSDGVPSNTASEHRQQGTVESGSVWDWDPGSLSCKADVLQLGEVSSSLGLARACSRNFSTPGSWVRSGSVAGGLGR
jgi:hypothetical protein